ncbi:MAG TPA: hypothetical protein DCM87_21170 [Planctomycetes bacterium]|nr:hypothetical protein [Planctomycetota bacterium]
MKVYILAGQSNMVGMGDLRGASPAYPNAFYSADPAIIPGSMPIGGAALAAHGMYPAADSTEKGAVVSLFSGAYDPQADYGTLAPVRKAVAPLGTVGENLPALDGPHTAVASAWIDVPAGGSYTLHAGFGDSTHAIVALDGKEVYRREVGGKPVCAEVALEAGTRYPITVTYLRGGSAAFWLEQVDIPARGDLEILTRKDGRFPYLVDDAGEWAVRNDVFYRDPRLFPGRAVSSLSVTSNNGKSIGPEVGFGCAMGTFHDEVVLLIKTSMGNRSLAFDFRPPSSGRTDPASEWESLEYRLMVKGVRETLDGIDEMLPDYRGQGYEIAGFGWFQGHKDRDSTREDYEKHLVNLINDLRKEFNAPKMPVVVATVGFGGYRLLDGPWRGVWEAQMAVGDPAQHPEFAGTVASVDTRDFWRDRAESPRDQDYHYHRNPETYLLVGEAMGRAMVRLQGGRTEAIPKSDREARVAAEAAAAAAAAAPTAAQLAAHTAAIKPLILDGALAAFASNPRYRPSLQAALAGAKPARVSPLLADTLDDAVAYYQATGIHDYDWQPFGGDMKSAVWEYHGFDLPDSAAGSKGIRDLAEISPPGMPDWCAPGFDAANAGWRRGKAPFGAIEDPLASPVPEWYKGSPREAPATSCDKDVLLLRGSFELPPLKEGHRYRIRVGGSVHHNCGEGYALYVNGTLLAESKEGIVAWRRQGHLPRGSHIWAEFRDEFKGGKVTIAVANFRMNNWTDGRFIPARAPLSVWLEEQKLPPVAAP